MWFERWFLSSNAKDIGVLYLIYALFAGLIGTAFSVLIRLELSGPGVQYIADNQLYNSIITAHAIIMIFFMVKKYYVLNSNFTLFKQVNSDNKSPFLSEFDNNDSYNADNENNTSHNDRQNDNNKHNYVKVFVDVAIIPDPNWIAGFVSGEGCFSVNIAKSSSCKTGSRVWLSFQITQHSRDAVLMKALTEYLGCGHYYLKTKQDVGDIIVSGLSDVTTKIIPLFEKYPIIGVKALDYADFCKALKLIKDKAHLTELGLDNIRLIKAGMNRGRKS